MPIFFSLSSFPLFFHNRREKVTGISCFLISRGLRSDVEWKLARAEDKSKPRNDEFLLSMLLATTVCTYVHFAYNCVHVWVCVTRKDNVVTIHNHEKERIHECVIYCLYVCARMCLRKSETMRCTE